MPRKTTSRATSAQIAPETAPVDTQFNFHRPPMQHQLDVFNRHKDDLYHGFLMDMGTGKTKLTIDNACYLYHMGWVSAILIVAPKGMYHQWAYGQDNPKKPTGHRSTWPTHKLREWDKDATELAHRNSFVYVWDNSGSARNMKQQQLLFDRGAKDLKVLIMNTEAFSTAKGVAFAEKFVRAFKTFMAIDEASLIKHHTAKRTKSLIHIGGYARYRRVLTGTPITNSPLDVYGFESFLNKGTFGGSWFAFRARYAVLKEQYVQNRSFKVVVGYRNLEELKRKLDSCNTRIAKEDCMDLPKKLYMRYTVPLTPEQEQLYRQMTEDAVAYLSDTEYVTAPIVLSQLIKLRQILCGYIKDDEGVVHAIPSNRLNTFMDAVGELSGKVVMWSPYRKCVLDIAERLKEEFGRDSYGIYMGAGDGVDVTERSAIQNAFNDPDSDMRFFIGTPQSGKYGLNFTCVRYTMFYATDYDLDARLQAEDRCHGKGRGLGDLPQTYIDFVSPGTVDEKILESLLDKKRIADLVTGDKWRAFLTGEELSF